MPNARPTPGLRLTPEKREQLRGLTEAVEHGTAPVITHEADLAARAFREIERLREDLEQLEAARAEAECYRQQYEALRAAVEDVVEQLEERANKAHQLFHATSDHGAQGLRDGLEQAADIMKKILAKESDKE